MYENEKIVFTNKQSEEQKLKQTQSYMSQQV